MAEKNQRIGVIGLGLMGTAIAERLIERGFQAHIWNRTRDKAETFWLAGPSGATIRSPSAIE